MSYYFVTAGLALTTLVTLIIMIDVKGWRRGLTLIIKTGQNPLVAYAGEVSLLPALLALTGIGPLIAKLSAMPWVGVAREAVYTLLLAKLGAWLADRKIFLRV